MSVGLTYRKPEPGLGIMFPGPIRSAVSRGQGVPLWFTREEYQFTLFRARWKGQPSRKMLAYS